MQDCIFCKIASGEFDSAKVYEDNDVFAFLDISPVSEGHCLVVPKRHYENIFDIDENVLKNVIAGVKKVSEKLKLSLGAKGVNLLNNSGKQAEQSVFHFHIHAVPRYENDGLNVTGSLLEKVKKPDIKDLKKLAEKIKNA